MRDFNHTVNVLVQAYLNDTLVHGDCAACAVGNIITSCGVELTPYIHLRLSHPHPSSSWLRYMQLTIEGDSRFRSVDSDLALLQINSTGYTATELFEIENAFEDHYGNIFCGLMAVVDVLAEIHGIDLTEKESAKALFVKA